MDVRQWNFPSARMVDEGHIDVPPFPRAPRATRAFVFSIQEIDDMRRLVREMGEHLEEHAEKGFVRDGAYTHLYDDLMAIHAATLPEDLNPHTN